MESNWTSGRVYKMSNGIMRLAYVNLLWILFSCVGLVIFGVFPATAALFAVIRKWQTEEDDIPIFNTFVQTYKKEFIKANVLGLFLTVIGYTLYFDYVYVSILQGTSQIIMSFLLVLFAIIYVTIALNIFPVFVHYDVKLLQNIKHAFYIGIANPLYTLMMVAAIVVLSLLLKYIPGLLPFFFPSIYALVLMKIGLQSFEKIVEKQEDYGVVQP
ncbi:YesL family protein [Fredinandcohnia sp. 179-A 10B2 NHS]|uniref:YesL family protein n=1 Tax=Fredinandcohnia sp. 179-A 10B2 NHS TaxID=3235176 RepID=UPI0039A39F27